MAGSYQHCNDNGKFQFDLIENLGDAYEACEHMYYMIQYLTKGDYYLTEAASEASYDIRFPHRLAERKAKEKPNK